MTILLVAALWAAEMHVVAFQDQQTLVAPQELTEQISDLALKYLQSSDYEATARYANDTAWSAAQRGPHIRISFPEPRFVRFTFSTIGPAKDQEVEVQDLLIPMSLKRFPMYLYVRSNGRIRAFGKYRYEQELELRHILEKAALLR